MAKKKISKQQQRVYRRRRIVALCILLLVLAGLVWGISAGVRSLSRGRNSGDSSAQASAEASSPASNSGTDSDKAAEKKQKDSENVSQSKSKQSSVPNCTATNTELTLAAPEPVSPVGGFVDFTVTINHKGSDSCLIDASAASRVLIITSGEQTIWRSDSCPVDSRLLLMAQGDHDEQRIRWNANATTDQCLSEDRLLKVNPGSYKAQIVIKSDPSLKSQVVPVVVQ
jgi:hypothetical protein